MKLLAPKYIIIAFLFFNAIQSIAQPCNPYPNYTTWMGYTDAWDDSTNWCPAIVPVSGNPAMNVRIPGGPSGPYTYYRPVIRPGVYALTQNLRVESSDTLFINAPNQSSLTVNDSLKIQDATSAIIVNKPVLDTVQVSTDTIVIPDNSPLNNHSRSRSFIVIPQSELLAQGMQANDIICKILFHIKRNSNGNPYRNCSISYYQTNMPGGFGTGYTAVIPIPIGSMLNIWSGDLYPPVYIPNMNDYGTIDLALQSPFAWNGSANQIVIEICYDNTGFPSTGFNDEISFTQTGNLNRYMSIRDVTNFIKPGCNLTPSDVINVTASWTTGSNIITLTNPGQAALVLPGMIAYPDGQSVVSIVGTTLTLDSAMTTTGSNTNLVLSNVQVISSPFRPNLTFVIGCDSSAKYPIFVRGHWENNGTFVPGKSIVTFDGSINDQQIGGQSKTTFHDLEIANSNHVIRLTDFTVEDSLRLAIGRLKLNLGLMTLLNPDVSAITRTAGFIQAETDQLISNVYPFGRLNWKMGSVAGLRVIPFVNTFGSYLPMDYTILSGIHDVVLGTYGTFPDNTNLPLPEVTNVFSYNNGVIDSSGNNTVDRFFLVKDSLGINPVANVSFRYANVERAFTNPSGASPMCAQRWLNSPDVWDSPFTGQVYSAGIPDKVDISNLSASVVNTSEWWAISKCSEPLGTGLEETDLEFIIAYPNPAFPGDIMNLVLNGQSFHPESIRIYSADGREVVREKFEQGNTTIQIPSDLSPGVYTVQFNNRKKNGTMRLVILER